MLLFFTCQVWSLISNEYFLDSVKVNRFSISWSSAVNCKLRKCLEEINPENSCHSWIIFQIQLKSIPVSQPLHSFDIWKFPWWNSSEKYFILTWQVLTGDPPVVTTYHVIAVLDKIMEREKLGKFQNQN